MRYSGSARHAAAVAICLASSTARAGHGSDCGGPAMAFVVFPLLGLYLLVATYLLTALVGAAILLKDLGKSQPPPRPDLQSLGQLHVVIAAIVAMFSGVFYALGMNFWFLLELPAGPCGTRLTGGVDGFVSIAVVLVMLATAWIGFRRGNAQESHSDLRVLPVLLLCAFLGLFGAHRFWVGKPVTAVLQLLTLGGLGVWWLIDCFTILLGEFRDKGGYKVR